MARLIPPPLSRLLRRIRSLDRLEELGELAGIDPIREALGRIEARQLADIRGPLEAHEFKVYSHAGEDGIIDFLVRSVPNVRRTFVEFGVEDYRESNTRFLLMHGHWSGLVIDGDPANVARIRSDRASWDADLKAEAAFVTRENIDDLLAGAGMTGDIGLLSVDVDGNDYWIFDAITVVDPAIAVVEYNHRFGPTRSVTIPYDPNFIRRRTDPSWLVCGASLAAMVGAAQRKGMSFVGCNSFGNNAFFVRTELLPPWLPARTAEEGFVRGRFREAIRVDDVEVVLSPDEERRLIEQATIVEVS